MKISVFLTVSLAGACSALSSVPNSARKPNPVIKTMAQGMNILKPVFAAEAKLQAAILGSNVDEKAVVDNINAEKKASGVLIYTYGLSPFSSEALSILDASGYEYKNVELGPEWFLLGPEESVTRVALSNEVENGATSLPKVFIGGKCIGGCSELAALAQNSELDLLMSQARVPKKGAKKSRTLSFFQ